MRNIILYLLLFGSVTAVSQRIIDFDIQFSEPYPKTLGELLDNSQFDVTVLNDVPRDIQLYFDAELQVSGANNYTVKVKEGKSKKENGPVMSLSSLESESFRSSQISLKDLGFSVEDLEGIPDRYTSIDNALSLQDTRLDEGMYTFCITAYDYEDDMQLSSKTCNFNAFIIENANLQVNFPNGQSFDCDNVLDQLVFDWYIDAVANGDRSDCFTYDITISKTIDDLGNPLDYDIALSDPQFQIVDLIGLDDATFDNSDFGLSPDIFEQEGNMQYVVKITAQDKLDQSDCTVLLNDGGESQIFTFAVQCGGVNGDGGDGNYNCDNCLGAFPSNTDTPGSVSIINSFTAGYFLVDQLRELTGNNINGFSGKGIAKVKLFGIENIPIQVEFNDIKVNQGLKVVEGDIHSVLQVIEGVDITMEEGADYTLQDLEEVSPDQYADLVSGLATVESLMDQINNVANGEGLKTPLGFDQSIGGDNYKFVVENFIFSPEGAKLTISANFPIGFKEEGPTKYFSIAVRNLCITPSGVFGHGELPLMTDIMILDDSNISNSGQNDGYSIKLNGCQNCDEPSQGSYLKFDCDGIVGAQLDCSVLFPEDVLIPHSLSQPTQVDQDNQPEGIELTEAIDNRVTGNFRLFFGKEGDEDDTGWMTTIGMSPFEIPGLKDWVFEVQDATFDMSKSQNPNNINFPNEHKTFGPSPNASNPESFVQTNDPEVLKSWTGINIKSLTITPPPAIRGEVFRGFRADNMVIDINDDPVNFSAFIGVETPYRNELKLGEWKSKLDRIGIQITNKNFASGGFEGKLYSPILHDQDYLDYKGLISKTSSQEDLSYALSVGIFSGDANVKKEVRIPLLLARTELAKESHVTLEYNATKYANNNGFNFDAKLVGLLKINVENATDIIPSSLGNKLKKLPLDLVGVPYILSYSRVKGFDGSYFGFNPNMETLINNSLSGFNTNVPDGSSLNDLKSSSPTSNPNLAGFKISIERFEFGGTFSSPKLTFEPKISFQSGEDGIAASVSFWIRSRYDNDESKFVFDDVGLECINLEAQTSTFRVVGGICYKDEDDEKRFDGGVTVKIPLGIELGLVATFGTKKRQGSSPYNFWRFQGIVDQSPIGIPLGPIPISLMAYGGGISNKMTRVPDKLTQASSNINPVPSSGKSSRQVLFEVIKDPLRNALSYNPSSNKPMQINIGLILCPTGAPESVNFGVYYKKFMSQHKLTGDVYMMSALDGDPEKSTIWGEFNANVVIRDASRGNFQIQTSIDGYVAFPPGQPTKVIYGSKGNYKAGRASLKIDTGNKQYYFHVGRQNNRVTVKMDLAGIINREWQSYFMVGTNIPTTLTLPPSIINILDRNAELSGTSKGEIENGISNSYVSSLPRPTNDGRGIALGLMYRSQFNLPPLLDKFVTLNTDLIAGFDLNITKSNTRKCSGYRPGDNNYRPGYNNWYALGQVFVGFKGLLGLFGADIAEVGAVALAMGGFPNPTWARADLELAYKINAGKVVDAVVSTAECGLSAAKDLFNCGGGIFWNILSLDWDDLDEDCNFDNSKKECIEDLVDGSFVDGKVEGGFTLNLNIGTSCQPSYPSNMPFGELKFIKSIRPSNNSIIPLSTEKIYLTTTIRPYRIVKMPIYSGQSVSYKNVMISIEDFDLRKGNSLISRTFRYTNQGAWKPIDNILEPNTEYKLSVKVKATYDGNEYFETIESNFKTEKLPESLTEMDLDASPGQYQYYYLPEEFSTGYIKFPSNLVKQYFDSNLYSGYNRLLRSSIMIKFRNIDEPSDVREYYISSSKINLTSGMIKFGMPDLNPNAKYEVMFTAKHKSEDRMVEIYKYSFATSRFMTLEEKVLSGEVKKDDYNNYYVEFDESFDSYDDRDFTFRFGAGSEFGRRSVDLLQGLMPLVDDLRSGFTKDVKILDNLGRTIPNTKSLFTDDMINNASIIDPKQQQLEELGSFKNEFVNWYLTIFWQNLMRIKLNIDLPRANYQLGFDQLSVYSQNSNSTNNNIPSQGGFNFLGGASFNNPSTFGNFNISPSINRNKIMYINKIKENQILNVDKYSSTFNNLYLKDVFLVYEGSKFTVKAPYKAMIPSNIYTATINNLQTLAHEGNFSSIKINLKSSNICNSIKESEVDL